MATATLNGVVVADSDATVVVEGNHYFPPESIKREHLEEAAHQTVCPWKGTAAYFTVVVDGTRAENAAWSYPEPKDAAANIREHVAFWGDVVVEA